MAIVKDTSTDFDSASATTHNITFNNAAGTFLIVGFTCLRTVAGDSVSSITYNGVNLTKVDHQNALNSRTANVWRLVNPATGSNTLTVTLAGAARIIGTVNSYTGVDATTPIDASNKGQVNSGTAYSQTVVTTADNASLFAAAYINRAVSAYGTNTTSEYYVASTHQTTISTADVTPAGSTSLSFTMATAEVGSAWVIASLTPDAGAGGSPTPLLSLMGVGS